jgi:hypothetical protein
MKVKCINIQSGTTLIIGKEYIVLEIEIHPGKEIVYRLIGETNSKSPRLYRASNFEITSNMIPSSWRINQIDIGTFDIGPAAWHEPGFWENCYDLEPAALEIYKHEARIIYEEEGAI